MFSIFFQKCYRHFLVGQQKKLTNHQFLYFCFQPVLQNDTSGASFKVKTAAINISKSNTSYYSCRLGSCAHSWCFAVAAAAANFAYSFCIYKWTLRYILTPPFYINGSIPYILFSVWFFLLAVYQGNLSISV